MGLLGQHTWKFPVPQGAGVHHALNPNPYRGIHGNDGPAYARDVADLIQSATPGAVCCGGGGAVVVVVGRRPGLRTHHKKHTKSHLGHLRSAAKAPLCPSSPTPHHAVPHRCTDVPHRHVPHCTAPYRTAAGKVAGFIHESIQGVGGAVPLADGYLPEVYKASAGGGAEVALALAVSRGR